MYYNTAKRVHAILGTSDGRPGQAEVKLDGKPTGAEQLGKDCRLEGDKAIVDIGWPFIYNLAKMTKPEVHEIEIIPLSNNFVFYTFVFG